MPQDVTLFKLVVDQVSQLTVPLIILVLVGYGLLRGVRVYESFVEGGKEGFDVFLKILPYIVAMLFAIGLLRECNALDFLAEALRPYTETIGMPADTLPVALMKPLSGTGSLGLVGEILKHDPDSFTAKVASTMFGSTDTTFYVLAVYFGYVNIRKTRHALITGLIADTAGILAAVGICHLVFR